MGQGSGQLQFHVLDVFAEKVFGGNPLAVVLGADLLATKQMQLLAREFGFSETAFPLAAGPAELSRGVDYRLRIFTPHVELPFAGHPSVGTGWLMARLGLVRPGRVVQSCGAGDLALQIRPGGGTVELTGGEPTCSEPVDAGAALAAVGLSTDDLADPAGQPARVCGTGLGYLILSVRPDALARCTPDLRLLSAFAHPVSAATGVWVAAWDPHTSTAKARMFAGDLASCEDPATGSAALAYGVWLVATGLLPTAETDAGAAATYTVRQGIEMGRPSTLACRVAAAGGRASRLWVAGDVFPVARGTIQVPPVGRAEA